MKDIFVNSKSFFFKTKRVWHVLKKPTKEEFEQTAKISAIGIGLIGVCGFIISIAMKYII